MGDAWQGWGSRVMPLLLETPLIEVSEIDGVVHAVVQNQPDAEPSAGAESAELMAAFVRERVAIASRPYVGIVLDARAAPAVFGPRTRDALEDIFRAAEANRVPVAAVISGTTQRLQFDSMAGIYAPTLAAVVTDVDAALQHVRAKAAR